MNRIHARTPFSRSALALSCLVVFITSLLATLSGVAGIKEAEDVLTEAGQKILNERLAEFPDFDEAKAKKEAEEKYPLVKQGTRVTLVYRNRKAVGVFSGETEKFLKIGTKHVPKMDLTPAQLAKYSPEQNAKLRRVYVSRVRSGHMSDKTLRKQELVAKLLEQYPQVSAKMFAKPLRKLEDKAKIKTYAYELKDIYEALLPIPEGETKKQTMLKALSKFLKKYDDLVLDGFYVVSLEEKRKREEAIRLREEARQKKLADRIAFPRTATPVFTPDGGEFALKKQVQISCSTPDAVIRYTLDGKPPTEESPIYKEPLTPSLTQRIKAVAFHPEYNDSDCAIMDSWDGRGLMGAYFNRTTFTGATVETLDKQVYFNWAKDKLPQGVNKDFYSAIWAGQIIPPETGEYTFYLQGDDAIRMWINGRLFIDGWVEQSRTEYKETIELKAGKKYDIKLAMVELAGTSSMMLEWSTDNISRQDVPSNCLYPMGREVNNLKAWNKLEGSTYPNRLKMTCPVSYNGTVLLKKYRNKKWKQKITEELRQPKDGR